MAVRYEPDYKGMAELMVSPGMHEMVGDFADAGMFYAISISPDDSGDYVTSFEVQKDLVTTITAGGFKSRRAAARIQNNSGHAAAVEWQYGHAVLSRTVDFIEWMP